MNSKEQVARWLELLEEYDREVHHRQEKQHSNADALSRIPSAPALATVTSTTAAAVVDKNANTSDLREGWMDRDYKRQLQESQTRNVGTKIVLELVALGKRTKLKDIFGLTLNIRTTWEQWKQLSVRD